MSVKSRDVGSFPRHLSTATAASKIQSGSVYGVDCSL